MEDPLETPYVCRCLPYLPVIKVATVLLALIYLSFGIFNLAYVYDAPGLLVLVFMAFIYFILTSLYFEGIRRENDFLMIPFLVGEIISRVIVGFMICFLWGTFVLASFDMFIVNSPIKDMSGPKFILLFCIVATLFYCAFLYILFPFYHGYRVIKKNNDHRRLASEECTYMKVSFTSRPTTV